jgi:hypothetical protein
MMSRENKPIELIKSVKRHLNITWDDDDTEEKLLDKMLDAEIALNHILGAETDYSAPGMEHQLFLNYMLYDWNDCINEFETAYRAEIYRIRHINSVKGLKKDAEKE